MWRNGYNHLGLVPTGERTVTPVPPHLLALVPKPEGKNETIKSVGADPLKDTVPLIKRLARRQMWQGRKLAQALKGATVEETLRNDFDFIFKHIQYVPDKEGEEQVRSLRRVVHEGKGDCDCFTNTLSNLMLNQGIEHDLRVAAYNGGTTDTLLGFVVSLLGLGAVGKWQHIYVQVPRPGKVITVDPVVHRFNYEVTPAKTKDFPMKLVSLDGLCPPKTATATATAEKQGQVIKSQLVTAAQLREEGLQSVSQLLIDAGMTYEPVEDGYEVQTTDGPRIVPAIIDYTEGTALINALQNPGIATAETATATVIPDKWERAAKWGVGLAIAAITAKAIFSKPKKELSGPVAKSHAPKKRLAVAYI